MYITKQSVEQNHLQGFGLEFYWYAGLRFIFPPSPI